MVYVSDDDMVRFDDCTLTWSSQDDQEKDQLLSDINFTAKKVAKMYFNCTRRWLSGVEIILACTSLLNKNSLIMSSYLV